jgi:acyl dehydratase
MAQRADTFRIGQTYEEVVVENLTRTQIVMYAGASGDFHPAHSDEVFARATGAPGIFAHGMLTMGMTGRMLTNFVGDGRLNRYGARFVSQVWPGDTLTAKATVEAIREVDGEYYADLAISTVNLNQRGEEVLSGTARARIDPGKGTSEPISTRQAH